MKAQSWKSQLADGRVFELRSKSTRYPPPCGLVINALAKQAHSFLKRVDDYGTVSWNHYSRHHNPNISVEGIRPDQFTSKRIARRRPDLERFNAEDLALIRYGYVLSFDGRIYTSHRGISIPLTFPAEWTVFWMPAYTSDEFRYPHLDVRERGLFSGAWYSEEHGGPRHLGYKYGHAWSTRHSGKRLACIGKMLRRHLPDLIETKVHVVRSTDKQGETCTTTEYVGDCAPLGDGRVTIIENAKGESIVCATSREKLC